MQLYLLLQDDSPSTNQGYNILTISILTAINSIAAKDRNFKEF